MKDYNQQALNHGIIRYSKKRKHSLNLVLILLIVFMLFIIWKYDIDETRADILHTEAIKSTN